jgi:hypothetical protein
MRIIPHVVVVLLKHTAQELVFRVVNRLDDEAIVAREVEEGTRFAGRAEFGENVFRSE